MPRRSHRSPPMLVVFDVDGTLTRSTSLNGALYARALDELFGFRDPRTDWSGYRETTDPGVLRQLFRAGCGRDPTDAERRAFRDRFHALIASAIAADRTAIAEVPGARALLGALAASACWRGAVASGAFEPSVLLKLAAAGLATAAALPRATGDDARRRDAILRLAMARARQAHGVERFARVVAVGDAPWDARAARALGLPFVGVGRDADAEALARAGAAQVLADFTDLDVVWQTLAEARPPGDTGRDSARR